MDRVLSRDHFQICFCQTLFQILAEFEAAVESRPRDDEMKTALALVDGNIMPKTIALTRPTSKRVIDILSTYKLVDVLHAIHSTGTLSVSNPRYTRHKCGSPTDHRVSY